MEEEEEEEEAEEEEGETGGGAEVGLSSADFRVNLARIDETRVFNQTGFF